MKRMPISPIGDSWASIRSELLTPEEKVKTDKKIAILGERTKRKEYARNLQM